MKKMTVSVATLLMIGLFMLPTQKTNAQVALAPVPPTTFGVRVGPSFSNMTIKEGGDEVDGDILVGLQGGVYANIPIAPQFYIQPSLNYEGKGVKQSGDIPNGSNSIHMDITERLHYLTLPIDLLFKPEMPMSGNAWFIGVGPYLGYGISGKTSYSADANGSSTSGDLDFDPFKNNEISNGDPTGDPAIKRFDAGANIQLGYEMANGFNIALNANLGLINLDNSGNDDNSAKNTSFGVTLGYTF